jgi:hypothetical protein
MSSHTNLSERLAAQLAALPVISTHEHLRFEREAVAGVRAGEWDLLGLFLVHYTRSDLISAGASPEALRDIGDVGKAFEDRHRNFVQLARRCANTSQFRCLLHGLSELYGGDVLNLDQAVEMNARMVQSHAPGVYDRILKERGHIQRMVRDCGEEFDERERFSFAVRLEQWIGVSCVGQVRDLEREKGISIHGLSDLVRAMKQHAESLVREGAIAFKSAMIYRRNPTVSPVTRDEAERAFQMVLRERFAEWIRPSTAWHHAQKPLQDYLVGELCDLAASLHIPMQIHTGLPEGNRLPYTWGDPSAQLGLILEHPSLNVHLLHMGHPYEREVSVMAKMYPNVFLDCSWVHQLNQAAAVNNLAYALDEVPQWKILGFGGDYAHHEGVYSALLATRRNLARVLANRIRSGRCSEDEAVHTGRMLLHDNASRLLFGGV